MNRSWRGSRKHILDWTSQGREVFSKSLNELIQPAGAWLGPTDSWMPQGYGFPQEAKLTDLGDAYVSERIRNLITNWWLRHKQGVNVPNWDLLATCSFGSQRGLVLVEAKTHTGELLTAGKEVKPDASANSQANHRQIGFAIEIARKALAKKFSGVQISRDTHYQLSNRVAFAWKLASEGVPVVLLYLGFIGDEGIRDRGEPLQSVEHWHQVMKDHIRGVLPQGLIGKRILVKKAEITFLIGTRNILEMSLTNA